MSTLTFSPRQAAPGGPACSDMGDQRPVEMVTRLDGVRRTDRDMILAGNAWPRLRFRQSFRDSAR
jgi:hypothetical protein